MHPANAAAFAAASIVILLLRLRAASWVNFASASALASAHAYAVALALILAVALSGCSTYSSKKKEAIYSPTEGVLETVAVLRRHIPDDTYRFPPANDFSGRNVYRASLIRLESLQRAEAEALRSGYLDSVIFFAKARALERLRAFDLAAQQYRESAKISSDLAETAQESAAICDRLNLTSQIGIDLMDPLADGGGRPRSLDPDQVRVDLTNASHSFRSFSKKCADRITASLSKKKSNAPTRSARSISWICGRSFKTEH